MNETLYALERAMDCGDLVWICNYDGADRRVGGEAGGGSWANHIFGCFGCAVYTSSHFWPFLNESSTQPLVHYANLLYFIVVSPTEY